MMSALSMMRAYVLLLSPAPETVNSEISIT